MYWRIIHGWRPYTTQNMVQPVHYSLSIHGKTDENHVLFSKYFLCFSFFFIGDAEAERYSFEADEKRNTLKRNPFEAEEKCDTFEAEEKRVPDIAFG